MISKIIIFLMAVTALVLSILALTKKNDKFTDKKLTPNDIYFIHVGKSGGSTIRSLMGSKIKHAHVIKPKLEDLEQHDVIILNLRDPISRFISAFNYSYDIINNDMWGGSKKAKKWPKFVRNKSGKILNLYWDNSEEYNDLINYFKTPNELAESLTSSNREKRRKANQLMNHGVEHINKSLGWYTNNGEIIKKFHKKIVIISLDNFRNDMKSIYKKVYNKDLPQEIEVKKKNNNNNKDLSPLARRNLYKYYTGDYATLDILYKYNLIDKKLYDKYYSNTRSNTTNRSFKLRLDRKGEATN